MTIYPDGGCARLSMPSARSPAFCTGVADIESDARCLGIDAPTCTGA